MARHTEIGEENQSIRLVSPREPVRYGMSKGEENQQSAFRWCPCPAVSFDEAKFQRVPKKGEPGWSNEEVQRIHKQNVLTYLPVWCYDSLAMAHPGAAFAGNGTRPAKILGFWGLALTWIPFLVLPCIRYMTFACS